MYGKSIPKLNYNKYGISYTEPFSGNITHKQITDYTKIEAGTNSKLVSLENELMFF